MHLGYDCLLDCLTPRNGFTYRTSTTLCGLIKKHENTSLTFFDLKVRL